MKIILIIIALFPTIRSANAQTDDIVYPAPKAINQYINIDKGDNIWMNPEDSKRIIPPFAGDETEGKCTKNGFFKNTQPTREVSNVQTKETYLYYLNKPVSTYSGINSIELKGNLLKIKMNQYRSYDGFEAETNKYVVKQKFEGAPGVAIISHALTLGIGLLLAPSKSAEHAFGCNEEFISNREIDRDRSLNKQVSTIWRKESRQQSFKITGFDSPYDSDNSEDAKYFRQNGTDVEIDLTQKIISSAIPGLIDLNVTCKDCDSISLDHVKALGKADNNTEITADFRYIKSQYDNQEKLKRKKITDEEDAVSAQKKFIEMQQKLKKRQITN